MNFPGFGKKDEEEPKEAPTPLADPAEEQVRLLEASLKERGSAPITLETSRLVNGHSGDLIFEIAGKHEIVKQFQEETRRRLRIFEMKPVTDIESYPKHVKEFIRLLKANTVAVFDKDGVLFIEVNMSVLRSLETASAFLLFYRSALSQFTEMTPYTEINEQSQSCILLATKAKPIHLTDVTIDRPARVMTIDEPTKVWVPFHLYVTIKLQDLIISQLRSHFSPDYNPGEGIDFLMAHGYEKDAIIDTLDISRATFFNHMAKLKKTNEAKTAELQTGPNA